MSAVHTLMPHDLLGGTRCDTPTRGQHRGCSRSRRDLPYLRRGLSRHASPLGSAAAVMQAIETCRTGGLGGPHGAVRPVWRPGHAVPLVWPSPLSQVPHPGQAALG